jgi:hypothetical protein
MKKIGIYQTGGRRAKHFVAGNVRFRIMNYFPHRSCLDIMGKCFAPLAVWFKFTEWETINFDNRSKPHWILQNPYLNELFGKFHNPNAPEKIKNHRE